MLISSKHNNNYCPKNSTNAKGKLTKKLYKKQFKGTIDFEGAVKYAILCILLKYKVNISEGQLRNKYITVEYTLL